MSFDANELIRVLKACRQVGVSELKIGDVEVKFGPGETAQAQKVEVESQTLTDTELEQAVNKANLSANIADAESRLNLMQIDNPALYEQLVLEQELEDNGTTQITDH